MNDLINTTLGAAALGEMFHRAACWCVIPSDRSQPDSAFTEPGDPLVEVDLIYGDRNH